MKQFPVRIRVHPPARARYKASKRSWYISRLGWVPTHFKRKPFFYLDQYFTTPKIELTLYTTLFSSRLIPIRYGDRVSYMDVAYD